ncbi:MAG TPA: APC family permease [Acidimicrobiales bacterium]|nr:APC family permease [Acidimicrobiales bacterium]
MLTFLKRLFVGPPLASSEKDHQRIPKVVALAVFSSDAISSTAYATEEILFVTALGASSLALGLNTLVPLGFGVALLLTIVVSSYRQTIFAYPSGGGSYVVSRENLGELPSLLAGASLLVDYILTVAVSISAGVAAIVSIPSFRNLAGQRVLIGIGLIVLITLANLRGVKESGRVFAGPTYVYILIMALLVGWGLFREFVGDGLPRIEPRHFEGNLVGGQLGLLLILKGFSQGAVALTGVEAISNGVPAFRRPESKNAATTLVWMGTILGSLFFGLNVLAHHLRPFPSHDETVLSQMGRAVLGEGPLYLVLQFATAAILTLAANTAYADFPRLSSIIARDGYLPRQFANLGDRLVFSNGILFLAVASAALLAAFGGVTNALIPLYAVGVFTSFTLSQAGMVIHHRRHREGAWKRGIVINAVGAVSTFVVLGIIGLTRFVDGAYISVIVVGVIMGMFVAIRRHYRRLDTDLSILPTDVRPRTLDNTAVVLVGRVHRGVVQALQYAKALRPNHLSALYVAEDEEGRARIEEQWAEFGFDVPLEIVDSKYRDLTGAVEKFLDDVDARWDDDVITVIIPEFVAGRLLSPTQLLHNQSAGALKLALLYRKNTIVISVPYHVDPKPSGG